MDWEKGLDDLLPRRPLNMNWKSRSKEKMVFVLSLSLFLALYYGRKGKRRIRKNRQDRNRKRERKGPGTFVRFLLFLSLSLSFSFMLGHFLTFVWAVLVTYCPYHTRISRANRRMKRVQTYSCRSWLLCGIDSFSAKTNNVQVRVYIHVFVFLRPRQKNCRTNQTDLAFSCGCILTAWLLHDYVMHHSFAVKPCTCRTGKTLMG